MEGKIRQLRGQLQTQETEIANLKSDNDALSGEIERIKTDMLGFASKQSVSDSINAASVSEDSEEAAAGKSSGESDHLELDNIGAYTHKEIDDFIDTAIVIGFDMGTIENPTGTAIDLGSI